MGNPVLTGQNRLHMQNAAAVKVGGHAATQAPPAPAQGMETTPVINIKTSEKTLSIADLLYGGASGPGNDLSAADCVEVGIDLENNALILTVHDPKASEAVPTIVTLAGLGAQYAAYDGLYLSDIIKGLDDTRTSTSPPPTRKNRAGGK